MLVCALSPSDKLVANILIKLTVVRVGIINIYTKQLLSFKCIPNPNNQPKAIKVSRYVCRQAEKASRQPIITSFPYHSGLH